MEDEIRSISEAKFRERVIQARRMTLVQRFESGIELFEDSLGFMRDAIRFQFPDADESKTNELLAARIRRVQQVRESSRK